MKIIGLSTSFILLVFTSSILSGYVLSIFWAWFVSPIFGIENISIPEAIGISLIISYLTRQTNQCAKEDKELNERIIELFATALAKPLAALAMGWIIKLFL